MQVAQQSQWRDRNADQTLGLSLLFCAGNLGYQTQLEMYRAIHLPTCPFPLRGAYFPQGVDAMQRVLVRLQNY